ncbi:MAG: hypothetical protein M3R59_03215 [Verrucomicrobiota bacterium]|nr:hypothetical protein [Verrucomicrobiota bacterium]
MPWKEWRNFLPDGFELYVERESKNGRLLTFVVVLLCNGTDIARYDNAHDAPHLDRMGRKNAKLINKVWYENLSNEEAFRHAIVDFSENYTEHFAFYCNH